MVLPVLLARVTYWAEKKLDSAEKLQVPPRVTSVTEIFAVALLGIGGLLLGMTSISPVKTIEPEIGNMTVFAAGACPQVLSPE